MGKSWSSFLWQLERKRKYYMSFHGSSHGGRRSRASSTMATVIIFLLCFLLYVNLWTSSSSSSSSKRGDGHESPSSGSGPAPPSSIEARSHEHENENELIANSVLKKPGTGTTNRGENNEDKGFSGEARLINPRIPAKLLLPPRLRPGPDPNRFKDTEDVNVDLDNLENASAFAVSGDVDDVRGGGGGVNGGGVVFNDGKNSLERQSNNNNNNKGNSDSSSGKLLKHVGIGDGNGNESDSSIAKLKRNFYKADTNRDGFLSTQEMSKWINEEIKTHFSTALKQNFDSFFKIDTSPRNGRVEWREYLDYHLKAMGYKGPVITPDVLRSKEGFKKLPKHIKVEIAALEARWSENANNDPDFLTVDEFLSFTHPEASPTKLLAVVQDTFATFDLDGDGIISKTEFDTTYAEAEGVDNVYKEDLNFIDTDNNHQINRVELMRYMDPKNTLHSDKDTAKFFKEVDANQDEKLSLDEILDKRKFVFSSKFYDAGKNLHANQPLHN